MKTFMMKIDGTVVSVKVYLKPADEVLYMTLIYCSIDCHSAVTHHSFPDSLSCVYGCIMLVIPSAMLLGCGAMCGEAHTDVENALSCRPPQSAPLSDVDQVGLQNT